MSDVEQVIRVIEQLSADVERQIRNNPAKRPVVKKKCRTILSRLGWSRRSAERLAELNDAVSEAHLYIAPELDSVALDDWVYVGYDADEVVAAATPKRQRSPLEKALVGPAGEHYVLHRLYRQGLLASLAPPRTPDVDILVLGLDGESIKATVQVKTRIQGSGGGWIMGEKHESLKDKRMFYAFVDLEGPQPVTYIMPSAVVADVIKKGHQAWLRAPGQRGKPHKDSGVRQLLPSDRLRGAGWMEQYREKWKLISHEVVG